MPRFTVPPTPRTRSEARARREFVYGVAGIVAFLLVLGIVGGMETGAIG